MSRLSRLISFQKRTFTKEEYTAERTRRLAGILRHFRYLTQSYSVPLSDAALSLVRKIFEDESIRSPHQGG